MLNRSLGNLNSALLRRTLASQQRALRCVSYESGSGSYSRNSFIYCGGAFGFVTATAIFYCTRCEEDSTKSNPPRSALFNEQYASIVVGGGTAGCTVAYLTAQWMLENKIPGKVLLVDRGVDFSAEEGPDPRIEGWHRNWGVFGEAHPTSRADGTDFPFAATDHRGIGGCGSHDTRITFQPVDATKDRLADLMGWTRLQLDTYYQAALNIMPVTRAINKPEAFYTAVIDALVDSSNERPFKRLAGDEHRTHMLMDTIGESSLAVFEDENRWTSAYLISSPEVRPSNLTVISNAAVDRVQLTKGEDGKFHAEGLHIIDAVSGEHQFLKLDPHGEVSLTSGAFGNVGILQRSGVGPAVTLQNAGVEVLVDNPEVGHGVDHHEIAVMFEWLDRWNVQDPVTGENTLPRGGVMGWPFYVIANFLPEHRYLFGEDQTQQRSTFLNAHFGAGFAEPYTDFPSVVCTPNVIQPNLSAGYRAGITSKDPRQPLCVVHEDQTADWRAMAQGTLASIAMLETLQKRGIVGKQLLPPFQATAENKEQLVDWIKENHYTVYHWCCTTRAGRLGPVADETFRVRSNAFSDVKSSEEVISNLRVGSASCLPDMPDANPHLSITAFSFALAERLVETQAERRRRGYCRPTALLKAQRDVQQQSNEGAAAQYSKDTPYVSCSDGSIISTERVQPRGDGEEYPALAHVASEHSVRWQKEHPDE